MQNALSSGINPAKTELFFTRKYTIPEKTTPSLNGSKLAFTEKAKYLGQLAQLKVLYCGKGKQGNNNRVVLM